MHRRLMMLKQPDNEIWYYAAEKVTLYGSTGVVSHDFANGKGVITFNAPVVTVGQQLRGTAITDVELPSGITSIGNYAFSGCTSLALTELPSGVTSIGNYAFSGCTSLALTELPSGVTSIGTYTFLGCTSLALTELPSGVTSIEYEAFGGCTNLALTELPSGITSIGAYAFNNCVSVTSLKIPIATPPSIGGNAFKGTTFPIYVPAESVNAYKAASGWNTYASRIFPIS